MAKDFEIDLSELSKFAKRGMKFSSRSIPQLLNQLAFDVAVRAFKSMKKVGKSKIQAELSSKRNITLESTTKSGKTRKRVKQMRLVNLIALRRAKRKGKHLAGRELSAAGQKILTARKRVVGFWASGYRWAIKDLWGKVRFKQGTKGIFRGAPVYGEKKGGAIPATDKKPEAVIWNGIKEAATAENKSKLRQAVAAERKNFEKRFEDRFKKEVEKGGRMR